MGLGPQLGRQYAHDLVYDICRKVVATGRPLADLLAENEEIAKHMSKAELAKLCDPANYLGPGRRDGGPGAGAAGQGLTCRPALAVITGPRQARTRDPASDARYLRRDRRVTQTAALTPPSAACAFVPFQCAGVTHERIRRIHRQGAARGRVRHDPRPEVVHLAGRRHPGPQGDRPDALRGDVRDQDRLPEFQVQSERSRSSSSRVDEIARQDRRHAARRGRPADRDDHHHARPRPATRPRSPIRSTPRSPASSAAWASRCCGRRPRTWKRNLPSGCASASRRPQRRTHDAVRTRRTEDARRRGQAARSDDATVRPIAGGTALMLMMKAGVFRPAKLDQPAQHRGEVFRHRGGRRRPAGRRHDHADGAGALGRGQESSRR